MWDYVLVARRNATISRDFDHLKSDLIDALARLHQKAN